MQDGNFPGGDNSGNSHPQSPQPWQQGPHQANLPHSQQPYFGQPQWNGQHNQGYAPPPRKKTGLIVALAVGLVVLIGLGIGGFFLFKSDDKSNANPGQNPGPGNTQPSQTVSRDELMERIRNTGPCEMHDEAAVKKYGPDSDSFIAGNLGSCEIRALTTIDGHKIDQSKPVTLFDLTLGDRDLDVKTATPETVGNHQIYLSKADSGDGANQPDTCVYYLPLPYKESNVLPISAKLRVRQFLLSQPDAKTEWPERCGAAKDYLSHIADKVLALAPRQTPPEQPSLSAKAPCDKKDEIVKQLPGWVEETGNNYLYPEPYRCVIKLKNPNGQDTLDVNVEFSRQEEAGADTGDKITIGGLNGIRDVSKTKAVFYIDTLVYRPADPDNKLSAHVITVRLEPHPLGDAVDPKLNDMMDKIAEIVVSGVK